MNDDVIFTTVLYATFAIFVSLVYSVSKAGNGTVTPRELVQTLVVGALWPVFLTYHALRAAFDWVRNTWRSATALVSDVLSKF